MIKNFEVIDDDIEYFKQYFVKAENEYKMVQTPEYLKWVYDETVKNKQIDDDPDGSYEYEESYNNKRDLLGRLIDYVHDVARNQNINESLDTDNMFEEMAYDIKLYDKYFHILQMSGQGTITIVRSLDIEPKEFVVIG